ncbi:MAG: hypothetical protein Q8N98_05225 [bacterium]|nr:hypothetical protein [bacterium]
MVTIIHGENQAASRMEFMDILDKNRDKEIVRLDGQNLALTDLQQALGSASFFAEKRLVAIENLISSQPKEKPWPLLEFFKKSDGEAHDVVLWEKKIIGKTILADFFSGAKTSFFEYPKVLFRFLESIQPANNQTLVFLHDVLKNMDAEAVFPMIIRQFRLLILAEAKAKTGPEEYMKLAEWQKARLLAQAKYFTPGKLKAIYQKLLEIDTRQKTGKKTTDLDGELDLLFLEM